MMSHEALLRDLKRLSRRELARTLQGFDEGERAQVLALIGPSGREEPDVPFATLAGLSPWLLKAIEPQAAGRGDRLTPATRLALKAALERAAPKPLQPERAAGRDGDTFVGRLLRARRMARAK